MAGRTGKPSLDDVVRKERTVSALSSEQKKLVRSIDKGINEKRSKLKAQKVAKFWGKDGKK